MKNSKWKQWIDFYNEIDSFVNVKMLKGLATNLMIIMLYDLSNRSSRKTVTVNLFYKFLAWCSDLYDLSNIWSSPQEFCFLPNQISSILIFWREFMIFPPIFFFRVNGHSFKLKCRLQSGFDENFMQIP